MAKAKKHGKQKNLAAKLSGKFAFKRPAKNLRSWLLLYGGLILATAITAAIIAGRYDPPLSDPFTDSQRSATGFQLYYPQRLPGQLHIDDASLLGTDNQIISMRLTDGRGKGYAFLLNQQKVPANFNFDTFYSSFGDRHDIKTKHGTAVVGTIDDGRTRIASLVTKENTWILVQAPEGVNVEDIVQVLQHLAAST